MRERDEMAPVLALAPYFELRKMSNYWNDDDSSIKANDCFLGHFAWQTFCILTCYYCKTQNTRQNTQYSVTSESISESTLTVTLISLF